LNIVTRRRWVRLYLGYYLNLMEDDQRGVHENGPLSCHFAKREEEFFEIGTVGFECLAILLCQGVESRLEDIVLIEVGSVGAGISTLHA
jgi:hypothetical protein